jgi:hypothetical protein
VKLFAFHSDAAVFQGNMLEISVNFRGLSFGTICANDLAED